MECRTIGFIGLGLLGQAMVGYLQKAGFDIIVLVNRDRCGIDTALAAGAKKASNARSLTAACDLVMICVSTSAQFEAQVFGEDGILERLRAGQIVIDFGTSLPASTKRIAGEIAQRGGVYLDAPLGRTPAHAEKGASGNRHTIKLLNNYFAMTTACAMSEAFAVAEASGNEREALYQVMAAGPNHSGMKSQMSGAATDTLREVQSTGYGDMMVPAVVDWMVANLRRDPQ